MLNVSDQQFPPFGSFFTGPTLIALVFTNQEPQKLIETSDVGAFFACLCASFTRCGPQQGGDRDDRCHAGEKLRWQRICGKKEGWHVAHRSLLCKRHLCGQEIWERSQNRWEKEIISLCACRLVTNGLLQYVSGPHYIIYCGYGSKHSARVACDVDGFYGKHASSYSWYLTSF